MSTTSAKPTPTPHPPTIQIEIDGEHYGVHGPDHTVRELLELSGNDPATTYLIERRGKHEIEHRDPDEVLHLHDGLRFLTGDVGPAPVA